MIRLKKPPVRPTTTPKNIIISHVYSSDNKGDAALTSVLITDLKRVFPHATIIILKLEAVTKDSRFEGIAEKPSFMYYALNKYQKPFGKLLYTLYMLGATLAWAAWRHLTGHNLRLPEHLRSVAQMYQQADLIVPVGGGYIRSRAGFMNRLNVPLLLHPLLLGWLLGKPTVLYSQSIGPFQNELEELLVAAVLKRMTLILVREDTSMQLLTKLGVTRNIERAIDSGFLLQNKEVMNLHKTYGIPADKPTVGVTVRSWLTGDAQIKYERAVASALDNIIETFGAHVVFIPQVTADKGDDDRIVSHRVHHYMQHDHAVTMIIDQPDHHRIKAIYNELDLLLGTRFHSVIFSLTSFVPVLAIEYEHKTSGIMHDLGLEQWVIKIEDVTADKLTKMLHRLIKQSDQYQSYLRKRLPSYTRRAEQTITSLKKSYDRATSDD